MVGHERRRVAAAAVSAFLQVLRLVLLLGRPASTKDIEHVICVDAAARVTAAFHLTPDEGSGMTGDRHVPFWESGRGSSPLFARIKCVARRALDLIRRDGGAGRWAVRRSRRRGWPVAGRLEVM